MKLRTYIQQTLVKWTQRRHDLAWDLANRYEQATGLRLYGHDDITDEANALSRAYEDPAEAEVAFFNMVKVPLDGHGPWFVHPADLRQSMLAMAGGAR